MFKKQIMPQNIREQFMSFSNVDRKPFKNKGLKGY